MLESIDDASIHIDALLPKRRQILNRLSDDSAPHLSTREMLESILNEKISLAKESKQIDEDPGKPEHILALLNVAHRAFQLY